MPNTLLTSTVITREALRIIENNLKAAKFVRRDYDDKFAKKGAKIGNTLDIRKPARFVGRTGQAISLEAFTETSVQLVLNTQFGVDVEFSSQELTLDLDDFSDRVLSPQIAVIANRIDFDVLGLYRDVYNRVGTPGTVPTALSTYLSAKQRLAEEASPMDNQLSMIVSPAGEASIVNALTGLFHESTEISRQYKEGMMGRVIGFKWSMDQNVRTHTAGTFTTGSTPLVNGASQTGSSLITDGWVASTLVLRRGDTFTLASVNAVNPQNRQSTGSLRRFVVTEDVTSTAGGAATIPISPAITPTGPFQTVSASPANNAAITPLGTEAADSVEQLAFHKEAFLLGMADLEMPRGTDMANRQSDKQLGLSIRFVRDYDVNQDRFVSRFDVLYGVVTLYPEFACRVAS